MTHVAVQTQLRPLIPGFLARVRADIALCKMAVTAGHHNKLRALCHKNSGSCAMYGFETLGDLFATLEHVSLADTRPKDPNKGGVRPEPTVGSAFAQLERYADQLTISFR